MTTPEQIASRTRIRMQGMTSRTIFMLKKVIHGEDWKTHQWYVDADPEYLGVLDSVANTLSFCNHFDIGMDDNFKATVRLYNIYAKSLNNAVSCESDPDIPSFVSSADFYGCSLYLDMVYMHLSKIAESHDCDPLIKLVKIDDPLKNQ